MTTTPAFLYLLQLSNPFLTSRPEKIAEVQDRWSELLHLADSNRTILQLYTNLKKNRNSIPGPAWDRLEKEALLRLSVWELITREIARMQSALRKAELRWMLIKTVRGFPREIRDLDILIFDNKFRTLRDALAPLGYLQSGKLSGFKMELKTYRGLPNGRKVAIAIDVHSRVSYEGLSFINEEEMWEQHRITALHGATVPIPSPEHQLVTTILNSFFGDGGLRLTDVFEFGELVADGAEADPGEEGQAYGGHGYSGPEVDVYAAGFDALELGVVAEGYDYEDDAVGGEE